MKSISITLFIIAIILIGCISPNETNSQSLEVKISADSVNLWLSEGKHIADIMDGYDERLIFLSTKYSEAIASNQEWFLEYAKTVPDGEEMPYHQNFGLTKEEYEEMLLSMKNMRTFSTGQEEFEIKKENNIISFNTKAENRIAGLGIIQFNTEKNEAYIYSDKDHFVTLVLTDTIIHKDTLNQFGSPWFGYSYEYAQLPKEEDVKNIKNVSEIKFLQKYTLIVGRVEKDNRILFSIHIQIKENEESCDVMLTLLIK